jgi:response regulator of citrate/malate metabolism
MTPETAERLKNQAASLLEGRVSRPTPLVEQTAIAILEILKDGNRHTAAEIGEKIGVGRKYVRDILRVVKKEWGLTSQTGKKGGWMMAKEISSN